MVGKALEIAFEAHNNQVDLAGKPYIFHPLIIASHLNDEKEIVVALLHDVIEDANVPIDYLSCYFDGEIIEALKLLTKKPGQDYFEYIEKLSHNPLAKKIKLLDLTHNMDITRLKELNDSDLKRLQKYHKAWRILTDEKE